MNGKRIRVLIVDDSAVVRQTISDVLSMEDDIEIMGTAADPFYAADKIGKDVPDVIILDIEMPRMDGLTFLQKIMSQHPIPVIICSTLAGKGTDSAFKALTYGAVSIITKPKIGTRQFLEESRILIADEVRGAARANLKKIAHAPTPTVVPKLSADVIMPPVKKSILSEQRTR